MDCVSIKHFLEQSNIDFTENEPIGRHTSFKTGGNADIFIVAKNADDLSALLIFCNKNEVPITLLGNGSNVLVSDKGIRGVVISLAAMNTLSYDGELIKADGGTPLTALCNFALENSLSGLEFAFGIPGSVGGAVVMNAGAYGGEIKDVLYDCAIMNSNGDTQILSAEELKLGYRTSLLKTDGGILLWARFRLNQANKADIKAKMVELFSRRKEKQPLEFPSAGSTFKRPKGYFAGALIESCGLKGKRIGGAMVSEKHAGFVINYDNATANDIKELISFIQETVLKEHGVLLEKEVIYIGEE